MRRSQRRDDRATLSTRSNFRYLQLSVRCCRKLASVLAGSKRVALAGHLWPPAVKGRARHRFSSLLCCVKVARRSLKPKEVVHYHPQQPFLWGHSSNTQSGRLARDRRGWDTSWFHQFGKAFAAAYQFLWAVFSTIGCNPIVKKQVGEDDERSVTFIAYHTESTSVRLSLQNSALRGSTESPCHQLPSFRA